MRGQIDWNNVRRVLVVRLRSIGDTVLSTPSLIALRRFLPDAKIDIMLEDWVAPLLAGHDAVDEIIAIPTENTPTPAGKNLSRSALLAVRGAIAWQLREREYDVAFNLHGGTTATFFVRMSAARHRIGLASYQYPFLYNHLLSSPADFWGSTQIHSAEQQLALLGFIGVPVEDRPKSRLVVTDEGRIARVSAWNEETPFVLLHPTTAFATKMWPTLNFARTAEFLAAKGLRTVAVASEQESHVLESLKRETNVPITCFEDLSLPEITALASKARLFVGNDSGIAHMAAAVNTPTVVVFGSSNRTHWSPWTDAPNEIVYEEFACQPCAGYECKEFGDARCISSVAPERVFSAIDQVLEVEYRRTA